MIYASHFLCLCQVKNFYLKIHTLQQFVFGEMYNELPYYKRHIAIYISVVRVNDE